MWTFHTDFNSQHHLPPSCTSIMFAYPSLLPFIYWTGKSTFLCRLCPYSFYLSCLLSSMQMKEKKPLKAIEMFSSSPLHPLSLWLTPSTSEPLLSFSYICLSFEQRRRCLSGGPQVAHPEGWLRLMPVIQLCWYTPRTHGRVEITLWLGWGGERGSKTDRERVTEGDGETER